MSKVAVVMGSDSDLEVMKPALATLAKFGAEFEVSVMSAHRTPDRVSEYAKGAAEAGIGVFIAAAGKAAHLAGVIASHTVIPVIGVPIKSSFDGLDALLSTVQMPAGIPVATVAVNGAMNAALLAVQMLAMSDPALGQKLLDHRKELALETEQKNEKLKNVIGV